MIPSLCQICICFALPAFFLLILQIFQIIDFIHLFCRTLEDLEQHIMPCKVALKKTGMLWISWPKGTSSSATNLKRDPIRDYVLEIGLVDVKVAAINKDWSGLKFVYRSKDR